MLSGVRSLLSSVRSLLSGVRSGVGSLLSGVRSLLSGVREGFTIIITRFPPARGGGEKLESSNDDDTLRDGRKGYPQQVCCGN